MTKEVVVIHISKADYDPLIIYVDGQRLPNNHILYDSTVTILKEMGYTFKRWHIDEQLFNEWLVFGDNRIPDKWEEMEKILTKIKFEKLDKEEESLKRRLTEIQKAKEKLQ